MNLTDTTGGVPASVLVADDAADMRYYYSVMLPRLGFDVLGLAENGQQLIDFIHRGHQPDVLVTDIDMPIMSGIEAIRKVCSIQLIPSVIASGNTTAHCADDFPYEYVYAFLHKPFSKHQLKAAVVSAYNKVRCPFTKNPHF